MNTLHTVYLSLGSNLGNRIQTLQKAILQINTAIGNVSAISSVYENNAMGFKGGDFLNLCIALKTKMAPITVLEASLAIELQMGRERSPDGTYQSRSIDIDLLYFDEEIIDTETLIVPHPRMQERRFVLKPLADVAPQFYHPKLKKDTRNLLQECRDKAKLKKMGHRLCKSQRELFGAVQFMVIEGNIGAGKTTLTKKIAADHNAKPILERFADNPFLPKFYGDQQRYAFPLEMSFLADRYQQFTDDVAQLDLFKDFMVSDYGISKSLIFAGITLAKEEFVLYRRLFHLMYGDVKKPGVYIYLYQTTERLLANIKKRGRGYEQTIEADYLDRIHQGYFEFMKTLPDAGKLVIDLQEMDFVAQKADYERILEIIANKAINLLF